MNYYFDINLGLFYHSAAETFHEMIRIKSIFIKQRKVLESDYRSINEKNTCSR